MRNFYTALRTTKKALYWIGAVVPASGEVEKVQNKLSSMKDGMMLRASATSLALNNCLLISLLIHLRVLIEDLLSIFLMSHTDKDTPSSEIWTTAY
jgi:hypothetical protein